MNKKSYSFPLLFNHSIRHRLVAFSILLLLSALFATTHAQPLHIAGSSTYYNELLGGSATNFGVPLTIENRRNTSVGVKTCSGKATGTGWIKFVQETNSWNTQWNGGVSAITLSGNTYMATAGKYDVMQMGANINVSITKDLFYTFIIGQNTTSDNDVSVLVTAQAPRNVTTMTHSAPQEGQAVTVTSTLNNSISTTSGNGAQYVYLAYSVNGGTYTSTPMTVTATNTVYTGTIPSNVHVADNTISYYTYITTVDGLTPSTTGFDFLCLSQSSVNTYNLNGGTSTPITIKAKRPSSWSNDMYLFFWGGEITSPSWDESSKMNSLGEGWYSFTLPSEITASNILFRNGITSGLNNQSDDINAVSQSTCYNLSQSGSSKATASQVTCPVIVVGAPTISAHKATVCENNFTDFASLYVSDYGILGSETGYAGGITFLWERSTDNVTWTTFTDGRKATINNIRPTRTGYYRCKMTRFSTSTNSNEDIYSNVIQVTAGSNCTSRTVCSKLPVIVVQTNVESFPTGDFLASNAAFQNAKKKISVDVKIIWDDTKDDTDNSMTEADFTNPNRLYYDKKARMNYRGSSSLTYSKKNYAFTVGDDSCTLDGTWIKDTKKMFDINEVNKERDFILYAAYSDPTMMRNKLALDLYSDMTGSWNSKSRYVELYVDGEYKGVYIFMEKVKEDEGRVQVQEDGYIFKFDKTDVWDRTTSTEGARSTFVSTITGTQGIPTYGITVDHGFEIAYPEWKEEDFTPEQWTTKWTYLRNRINDFENALKNGNYTDVNQYIDYESWADYFIMQEFAKNIDGYRISVWFTMETATSPIKMIPLWDNELAFNIKNITGKGNTSTTGLMVENSETRTDAFAIPFWWTGAGKTNVGNGLFDDNCFKAKVKERWLKHTTTGGALSQTNIRAKIDDMHTSLLASSCSSTPVSREFAANARWSTSWAADTTNVNTWINPTTGRRKGLDDIISTWPTILSSATINTVNDVNLGDNVTFTATVTGTGTYTYAWYFCATNSIDKTTWTLLNANGTSTYEITNIQSQHDGYYHCIVTSTTCSCISETLTSHLSLDTKTLTVISANTTQGTVTGGGSYTIGSNATITALPKPGYRFVRWSDNNTNASRDITVSANANYIAYFTLQTYTITLQGDNGTFTGAGTYMYNNVATITAIPDTGYDFVKWSDNDTNASRSITVTGNVTLTATFAIKQYTVTLTAGTGGNVTGAGNYNHGQSVTITATPSTGYNFVKWSDNVTTASRTFNATENLTLTATFAIKQYTVSLTAGTGGSVSGAGNYNHGQSVTITATPSTGYNFVKWSDNVTTASRTFNASENLTLTATFAIKQYTVSLTAGTGGSVSGAGNYNHGQSVTITATPSTGYNFVKWSDNVTTASRTFNATENITLTATFAIKQYTVSLTAGTGGSVSGAGNYNHGQSVTITATPTTGYNFVKWSDNNTNASRTFNASENLTLTATFAIKQYTVSLTAGTGGSVSGAGNYNHGQSVTITATPTTGYNFVKWSDNVTTASRTFNASENLTLTATFAIKQYTVSLTAGTGGSVSGAGNYNHGQSVTITATPTTGYNFVKWSDNNTNASRTFNASENLTLTATFAIKQYTVTLTAGTGGNVTGAGNYNHGQSVTITATPTTGYDFVKWSDNNTNASRTFNASENLTLTATFAIKQYTVSLTAGTGGSVSGAGNYNHGQSVTITATPSTGYNFVKWSDNDTNASRSITVTDNISLTAQFSTIQYTISTEIIEGGHITGGGNYPYGTKVTLVAVPDEDYTFYLWNDGHTSASREITVTEDKTYIAYFEEKVYTEVVEKQPTEYIVYSKNLTIFVEAPDGSSILIQDMMGRLLAKNTPTLFVRNSGIYFIHINDTIVKLIVN